MRPELMRGAIRKSNRPSKIAGLKLNSAKEPAEILAIDLAAKPSANRCAERSMLATSARRLPRPFSPYSWVSRRSSARAQAQTWLTIIILPTPSP
jgi:hypothetical protein